MRHIDGIISIDQKLDRIIHLLFICIIELFKCRHVLHITCCRTDADTFVYSIRKYQLQRTAHIEKRRIMPSFCLTGLLWFHTSNDVIISCILQSQSSAHQRRYDHFVIVICRKSDSGSCQLCCPDQEFVWCSVPYPHRK